MSKVGTFSDTSKFNQEFRKIHQDQADKIERVNKTHRENLEKIDEQQGIELTERRTENQKEIDAEVNRKNEQLEQIKTNLSSSQAKMQSQLKELEESHRANISNINQTFHETSSDKSHGKIQNLKEVNTKYQNIIEQTHQDGKRNLNYTKQDLDRKKTIQDQTYERKFNNSKQSNEFALNVQNNNYTKAKHNQEIQHERLLNQQKTDFYKKSEEEKIRFEHDKEKTTELQHKLIEQEKSEFEKRYNALVDEQKQLLAKVNERSQALIDKQKLKFNTKIESVKSLSQDSFYKVRDIEPDIQDHLNHIEVKIPIAEHEKDSVRLNVLKRKLKLSLDRKFEDRIDSENAKISNTRVESLTKEIPIDTLLDSKKMQRKYEDGFLIYTIAKL